MDDITKLIAIAEIRDLKARYFRAIDEKDAALLRGTFARDVELDYRGATTDPNTGDNAASDATGEKLVGADASVAVLIPSLQDLVTVHHASEPEIEIIDAVNARAIWPMVDRLQFPRGPHRGMTGYGHYRETYVKEDGQWRIKTLRLTRLRLDFIPA